MNIPAHSGVRTFISVFRRECQGRSRRREALTIADEYNIFAND